MKNRPQKQPGSIRFHKRWKAVCSKLSHQGAAFEDLKSTRLEWQETAKWNDATLTALTELKWLHAVGERYLLRLLREMEKGG